MECNVKKNNNTDILHNNGRSFVFSNGVLKNCAKVRTTIDNRRCFTLILKDKSTNTLKLQELKAEISLKLQTEFEKINVTKDDKCHTYQLQCRDCEKVGLKDVLLEPDTERK